MENDFETKVRKNNQMKKMKFIPKDDIEFISINGVEGILIPDNDVNVSKNHSDLPNKIITTKQVTDNIKLVIYSGQNRWYYGDNTKDVTFYIEDLIESSVINSNWYSWTKIDKKKLDLFIKDKIS